MILIAGPCVIENKDILRQSVEAILEVIEGKNIDFYFKSSWRKDNRTLAEGFFGLDPFEAIQYLKDIKKEYNVPICTDIHNISDLTKYELGRIDVIQIPAYLAKQQSLLKLAAMHTQMYETKLHIKKPQFVSAEDMVVISNNAWKFGAEDIILTDRGTMWGPDRVFMDPRHVDIMHRSGFPILCDITHPNKNYSGHTVDLATTLGKSYISAGAEGIFLETHPDCSVALCDKETMIENKDLDYVIKNIYELVK